MSCLRTGTSIQSGGVKETRTQWPKEKVQKEKQRSIEHTVPAL
jgi:hypothetical protein